MEQDTKYDKIKKLTFMYESQLINKLIMMKNYIYSCVVTKEYIFNLLNNLSYDELKNFFIKNEIESAISYDEENVMEKYFEDNYNFENLLKYSLDNNLEFMEIGFGKYLIIDKSISKETRYLIAKTEGRELFDLIYKYNELLGDKMLGFEDFILHERLFKSKTRNFDKLLKQNYMDKEKILDYMISNLQKVQQVILNNELFKNI